MRNVLSTPAPTLEIRKRPGAFEEGMRLRTWDFDRKRAGSLRGENASNKTKEMQYFPVGAHQRIPLILLVC